MDIVLYEKMSKDVIIMTHEAFEPYEPSDLIDTECYSLLRFECEFESHLEDEIHNVLYNESHTCIKKKLVIQIPRHHNDQECMTIIIPITFHKHLEGDGWLIQRHRPQLPSPLLPRAQYYYQDALRLLKKVVASFHPYQKVKLKSPNQMRRIRWATLKVLDEFLPTDVARAIVETAYQR